MQNHGESRLRITLSLYHLSYLKWCETHLLRHNGLTQSSHFQTKTLWFLVEPCSQLTKEHLYEEIKAAKEIQVSILESPKQVSIPYY